MTIRSILFVELLGGLGDLLMALPAVHALARSHPAARVTVLTFGPGESLLSTDPLVAETVRAEPGPPEVQRAAVAELVARGFDLAVTDTRYGGIPEVLSSSCRRAVTDLWRGPPPDERIDLRFLALLAAEGVIDPAFRALPPRVVLTAAELEAGRRTVATATGGKPAALLLPEAGMTIKEWSPARFRALARRLTADGLGVLVAARRRDLAAGVVRGVPGVRLLPPATLRQLAAVAAAAEVCVAGDTGPARLAAAAGTPTVALYGPTWAGRFGLRDDHASLQSPLPCHIRNPANMTEQACWYSGVCVFEDRRTCTDELSVADVYRAVTRVLPDTTRVPAMATRS